MDLKTKTIEELKELVLQIKDELTSRTKEIETVSKIIDDVTEEKKIYTFDFYAEGKTKVPFVAKCTYNRSEQDGISRKFKPLDKTNGYNNIVVTGKYTAEENEILYIRNNGMYYYIIMCGKLIKLANPDEAKEVAVVKQYLKGDIELNTMLEVLHAKPIETEVLDELKD